MSSAEARENEVKGNGNIAYIQPGDLRRYLSEQVNHQPLLNYIGFDDTPNLFPGIDEKKRRFVIRHLLGGKGDGLAEMKNGGLNVPSGFVLTTELWKENKDKKNNFYNELGFQEQLLRLELSLGQRFGDRNNPLILAVRSSPVDSMPGAMATVTNVGINDMTLRGLSKKIGHQPALRAYFQLITEIGRGCGIPEKEFGDLINHFDSQKDISKFDTAELKFFVDRAKKLFYEKTGFKFPQDLKKQLTAAIKIVFTSYDSPQSEKIREKNDLEYESGTACVIMKMIFGNVPGGGSGVLITRDPDTFKKNPVIIYRSDSQGQAVVGNNINKNYEIDELPLNIQKQMGALLANFQKNHPNIPQEVEFVSDGNELWVVQKRTVPLSVLARARQIMSLQIPPPDAARILRSQDLEFLLKPGLNPKLVKEAIINKQLVGTFPGTRISPGIAYGKICRDLNAIKSYGDIIYVGPLSLNNINDLPAKILAAVLTSLGSPASHLARHAEKLGSTGNIPIAFAIPPEVLNNLPDGTSVTVDASTPDVSIFLGTVLRAKIKNANNLSLAELRFFNNVLKISRENEWRRLTEENTFIKYKKIATKALQEAQLLFKSEKAIQEYVKNILFPSKICEQYNIAKPDDIDEIKNLLLSGINQGNDVSIRTCHKPELPGKNPYKIFSTGQEIESFFYDSSYQNLISPVTDHQVTEVLIGSFPKGKLDEEQKNLHAAWTYSVKDNTISLIVNPHTPTLRNLGNANLQETFLYSIGPFTAHSSPHDLPVISSERIPEKYKNDPVAKTLFEQIKNTVLDWIGNYDLNARLAGLTSAFPHPYYSTPCLEGQARVGGKWGKEWTLVYGTNIDKLNNGDKNSPQNNPK